MKGNDYLWQMNLLQLRQIFEVKAIKHCAIYFLLLSAFCNDAVGQLISFFILTVVGAESAIGLAILIAYYRVRGNIKTIQYAYLRN